MKRIRTNHVTAGHSKQVDPSKLLALENLRRLCQMALETYGPEVDSLLSMECRLEVEEWIYNQLQGSPAASPVIRLLEDPDHDKTQDEDHDKSSKKSSQEFMTTSQIDYEDYFLRLRNLYLMQEQYQRLINMIQC